jgi:hypothetical protein
MAPHSTPAAVAIRRGFTQSDTRVRAMRFIYLVGGTFFFILFLINVYLFRRKEIGFLPFLVWALSLLILSALSLFPDSLDSFADIVGMKLRINFIIVVIGCLLFSFAFSQWHANDRTKRELGRIGQRLSICDFYLSTPAAQGRPTRRHEVVVKMAAYNESENLPDVLGRMPGGVDVLVIDDASPDETGQVARSLGAMVARHHLNLGQGIADITGFLIAFDMGYRYVVEMDADGQHDPRAVPLFVETLKRNPDVDIVVGSRILGSQDKDASALRTRFLPLYTRMINWATGYSLTDGLCGYKAYRMGSLVRHPGALEGLIESEYIAAEMYMRFSRLGLRIIEIPVNVSRRTHGKSRKGTFRYGAAVAWIILRSYIDKRI